jgi:pilus assembly protein Flp/PilA
MYYYVLIMNHLKAFFRRTDGASAIEYAILLALVAVVLIGLGSTFSKSITDIFDSVKNGLAPPAS